MKYQMKEKNDLSLRDAFGEVPEGFTTVLHQTLDRIKDETSSDKAGSPLVLHSLLQIRNKRESISDNSK